MPSPAVRPEPPVRLAGSGVTGISVTQRRPVEPGRTINLTGRSHPAGPTLDDNQAGPKVLVKIDLRKPTTPARPAPPTGIRPGGPPRPGLPPGIGEFSSGQTDTAERFEEILESSGFGDDSHDRSA